ncbi:hypothetical protein [Bradyrhizobium sp. sGM-13]|nr:hypothetical protein [Bradyrhizobium sp. sGM-13]
MHDARLPLPTQRPEGIAHCFCGQTITSVTLGQHVLAARRAIGA